MTEFRYSCPHCSGNNVIQAGNVGHIVRCVHCRGRVAWEGETPVRGPDEPERDPGRNWRLVRSGILPLIVGVPPLLLGCWNIVEAYRSRSWPSVQGVILSSKAQSSPDNQTPSHGTGIHISDTARAEIRYRYEVDGTSYENDCVRFGQVYSSSRLFGRAKATASRHPPGPGTIYYDQKSPDRSVLEPGFSFDVFLMPGVSLIFTGLGVALVFRGLRPLPT